MLIVMIFEFELGLQENSLRHHYKFISGVPHITSELLKITVLPCVSLLQLDISVPSD